MSLAIKDCKRRELAQSRVAKVPMLTKVPMLVVARGRRSKDLFNVPSTLYP